MKNTCIINPLSAPTWNKLRMNDVQISLPGEIAAGRCRADVPAEVTAFDADFPAEITTGCGKDIDDLFRTAPTAGFGTGADASVPVKLEYSDFDTAYSEYFEAEDGARMNVIQTFRLHETGTVFDRAAFRLGKGAKVTLTQIFRGIPSARTVAAVGAELAQDADFRLIQVFLSGCNYSGVEAALNGRRASFGADTAYNVGKREKLDINYNVIHIGKNTSCDIDVAGTLREDADKIFRGTIDFRRGSAGSVGTEMEDVMLLSDDIINKTIPVILCKEEDVEGNHGATIGEVPEETLFYLMSRGLQKDEIFAMLSAARLERVIRLIPDERTRCGLLQ